MDAFNYHDLNYHDLQNFSELTTSGDLTPSKQIELRNVSGNRISKVSYMQHALDVCKKNNENLLSLFSTIMNQINSNMRNYLEVSPVFREKIRQIVMEHSYDEEDFQIMDLFPIQEERFNYPLLLNENEYVRNLDSQIQTLENLSEKDDIYPKINDLITNCCECSDRIKTNMSDLINTTKCYQPKYGEILIDLGTRHKPFYMEGFLKSDSDRQKLIKRVNREVSERIPDNIDCIAMNSGLWLPQYITKESKHVQSLYKKLLGDIETKRAHLEDMRKRLPDPNKISIPQKNFLENLVSSLMTMQNTESEESEEEERPTHSFQIEELQKKMEKEVDKSKGRNDVINKELQKEGDNEENEPKQMFHLELKKDKGKTHFYSSSEEEENEEEDEENDEDN